MEFGNSLKNHTPKERYTEIRAHVEGVEYDENGVKNIVLKDGTKMSADLYIDCTGFRRLLIGEMAEFKPYAGLLNNAAIWGPVKEQVYRPSTISEAQPHGWIWETPTWGQIGSGYVFSDDFITVEQAEDHIRNHWKKKGMEWNPLKSVKFTSGRLENIAVKNVIANGLGQSFIEPLEATAIMVTCVTIRNVSKMFNKHNGWSEKSSRILSTVMERFLEETKEFVLGHYTLTDRTDTDYWRAYHNTDILEYMAKMIEKKLEKEWVSHGETNLNGYNWASMLIGYDKPYLGKLPKIESWQMDNYEFYTKQLVENYRHLYGKNLSIEDRLKHIHS
jgi:tryptophan halogenase